MSLSRIIDLAFVGLMLVVGVLALAGAELAAIVIGAVSVPAVCVLFTLVALGHSMVRGRSTGDGKKDFSSLLPGEEAALVPHEQTMRANGRRSARLGLSIAGGVFVVTAAIILTCYTPCSKLCQRPPASCKTDKEMAEFMATCEENCARAKKQHGAEYVENLTGCAFANSATGVCETLTKQAQPMGLWCASK